MDSESGRPSSRRWSETVPVDIPTKRAADDGKSEVYVPHLFDLISATSDKERRNINVDLPQGYLEVASVDSSHVLGEGASFRASARALPPPPQTIETTTDMGWGKMTTIQRPAPRPTIVVFKTARVAFSDEGYPKHGYESSLRSVLTEVHALTYPSLINHPNIISFLGIAWGTNEYNGQHKLPALVVEHADYGNLEDFLDTCMLNSLYKVHLCFDITSGLHAIHSAGLVHGDVKDANVLICSGSTRVVAKLADFGFSIVQETENKPILLGGTWPWKAPETRNALPLVDLKSCDVYSVGLLIWVIALNGFGPFHMVLDNLEELDEQALHAAIDQLIASGHLIDLAKGSFWFTRFLTFMSNLGSLPTYLPVFDQSTIEKLRELQELEEKNVLSEEALERNSEESYRIYLSSDKLLSKLDEILSLSLTPKAEIRNLDRIIEILAEDAEPADLHITRKPISGPMKVRFTNESNVPFTIQTNNFRRPGSAGSVNKRESTSAFENASAATSRPISAGPKAQKQSMNWKTRGFKNHYLSWDSLRDMSPGLQSHMFNSFPRSWEAAHFYLCAVYVNGYGHFVDDQRARECLEASVMIHDPNALRYYYRIVSSIHATKDHNPPTTYYLQHSAVNGSRAALEDLLSTAAPQVAQYTVRFLSDITGGVGAGWYHESQMLHGFSLEQWRHRTFFEKQLQILGDVNTFRVNLRGDTLLHLTAACGWHGSRTLLVDRMRPDINCRNHAGDTPLLSACRAGQDSSVTTFLECYKADASIPAYNGETPLHWLVQFPDNIIEAMLEKLVNCGAAIDAMTTERVSHGNVGGNVDNDHVPAGTPLHWAVHFNRPSIVELLLRYGADPNRGPYHMKPLSWAAYCHYTVCLRIMVEHVERQSLEAQHRASSAQHSASQLADFAVPYTELHYAAVHSADRFSMILRNGNHYLDRLHSTLELLREKTKLTILASDYGKDHSTLLCLAVSEAHEEVVEYMLRNAWHSDELNVACGQVMRTPFLEAVRWNRRSMVELLVRYGALVDAKALNPFNLITKDRSALHVYAHEGFHERSDFSLAQYLLELGLAVDGDKIPFPESNEQPTATLQSDSASAAVMDDDRDRTFATETPFTCALRNNTFVLCDILLHRGASPNALSYSAGLFRCQYPTTILGHIIISNARYSLPRLRYLLSLSKQHSDGITAEDRGKQQVPEVEIPMLAFFVVDPSRNLTALHRSALGCDGVQSADGNTIAWSEYDRQTNSEILRELLLHFDTSEKLNARSRINGRTALHLAAAVGNRNAIKELLNASADKDLLDSDEQTAHEIAGKFEPDTQDRQDWDTILELLKP